MAIKLAIRTLFTPSDGIPYFPDAAISSWRDECSKELSTRWNATDKVARKGVKFRDGNYARAHDWDARLTYNGRRKGNENGHF